MAERFICSTNDTVVRTKAGLIRGFRFDGEYKFYGIKYADAERFHSPREVEPLGGSAGRPGLRLGLPHADAPEPGSGELKCPHRYWPESEDCQYLNIWTNSLDSGARRPVMVWIHGGGFTAGSSIEQDRL